jgi:hypothetical protein
MKPNEDLLPSDDFENYRVRGLENKK